MNSRPVKKSSIIIDEEVKNNRSYTTTNAKIILDSRNKELNKINKRLDVIVQETNNVSRLHSTTSLAIRHIYPSYFKEVKQ